MKEVNTTPMMFRTDKGTEYVNAIVKRFLNDKNIKHVVTQNSTKAAFAERAIYTIKRRLLRAMVAKKTKHWLGLLPSITASYNKSYHRTIGMKPNEVTKDNEAEIWKRVYWPKIKVKKRGKSPSKTKHANDFKFKVGDTVKITTERGKFDRGYNTRFSLENFSIADRNIRQGMDVYTLKDMDNELILGTFYPQEIQRVTANPNQEYAIEKVLKTRNYKGKKHCLFLTSSDSSVYFPFKSTCDFQIELPEVLLLRGNWTIALSQIPFKDEIAEDITVFVILQAVVSFKIRDLLCSALYQSQRKRLLFSSHRCA